MTQTAMPPPAPYSITTSPLLPDRCPLCGCTLKRECGRVRCPWCGEVELE